MKKFKKSESVINKGYTGCLGLCIFWVWMHFVPVCDHTKINSNINKRGLCFLGGSNNYFVIGKKFFFHLF